MTPIELEAIHIEAVEELRNEFPMIPFTSSLEIGLHGFVYVVIKIDSNPTASKHPVLANLSIHHRKAFMLLLKNELKKAELDMGRTGY